MLLLAILLQAATPGAVAAPPAETAQALFNEADADAARQDWSAALLVLDRLEARLGAGAKRRSLAIVRVRRGEALYNLGRSDDALEALGKGMADLPASDATLSADRRRSLVLFGRLEEERLDYAGAARDYQAAAALPVNKPAEALDALAGVMRTSMFDDAPAALAASERALAIFTADPKLDKKYRGQFHALRGRALMNAGRLDEARAELRQGVTDLGGLTDLIDRADVSARSDMAIAAVLRHDDEEAKKYMAYTGAGRGDGFGEFLPTTSDLPECGVDGVTPEDVAVVQFAVRENGEVFAVTPIYASRQGSLALVFARKVAGWSWTPKNAAEIKPFYRLGTRLELRCTNAVPAPSPKRLLEPRLTEWLARIPGAASIDEGETTASPHARLVRDQEAVARVTAASGADAPQLVPLLYRIGTNPIAPDDVWLDALTRARRIAKAAGAPPGAVVQIALVTPLGFESAKLRKRDREAAFASMMADAGDDAHARAVVNLTRADDAFRAKSPDADRFVEAVIADTRLDPHDPVRVGALLRRAAYRKEEGDLAGAQQLFQATGLSAGQCALVDAQPVFRRSNASSNDFPQEALRWGFEGWAFTEFDIAADGRTRSQRAVIAFPPFIFGPAAAKVVAQARFSQTFRPGGELGCGGQRQRVRFQR